MLKYATSDHMIYVRTCSIAVRGRQGYSLTGMVQAVGGSGSSFAPEGKWAVLVLEECTDAFCQGTVRLFSDTILLGGMGYSELKQDSMLRTVVMKALIYILAAIVSA